MYVEDIYDNFGLSDGKRLTTMEIDGVLLSCLKGLYIKHRKLEAVVEQLVNTIKDQQEVNDRLEAKILALESKHQ